MGSESTIFIMISAVLCQASAVLSPVVIEEQYLFQPGNPGEVDAYRIPISIMCPDRSILAFAEGRKYGRGDYGSKFLAMRRSKDSGDTWTTTEFVLDDNPSVDGLNLGNVIIDYYNNSVIIVYVHAHTHSELYMVKSLDWGVSWGKAIALSDRNPKLKGYEWTAGPGYGIQLKYGPHKGRLLSCGHGMSLELREASCLYSDDYGDTWHLGGRVLGIPFNHTKNTGDFAPGESQIVEMYDGTLIMMSRNTEAFHCKCRIFSKSYDAGESFPVSDIWMVDDLPDPNVCGSILHHNGILYFSGLDSRTSRTNMTLYWSLDNGITWPGYLPIYLHNSAYSCLTAIDNNNIGLVYEKGNNGHIAFSKIRLHA
ncbi:MGC81958 protein-like precursor [Saccoglossus kowalevskii]|uniref:Sialidase-1 n=1 Tax=Saccoglossus kowalevskii TaxID=10224 RepID=K0Q6T6_SACKO|nr:MGC81958 protein-like precursor [Saccoglossus kowalevskii]DAA35224.1 TPA_inf: sialidase NEU1.3 [Saccoglossus kowalevskii]